MTSDITRKTTNALSRRTVLKGMAIAGLSAPYLNTLTSSAHAAGTGVVNFAGYGGSFNDALRETWLEPFEKETGIKVNLGVNAGLSLAKLQTMNPAGAEWDIIDMTNGEYITGVKEDLFVPLDKNLLDTRDILPNYVFSHGFCYMTFAWVIGWNKKIVSAPPANWSEFWDKSKYPSKRSLMVVDGTAETIEAALMADGITPDKMYPVDIDRAFASLDKLGRENIVWTQSLQEPVQRIGSGETPLGGIYTGRAIMANRAGADIGFSVNQGIIGGDTLGVIKNSNNKKEAFALLNFMATRGDLAAKFAARTSYCMPHLKLESLLPKDAEDVRIALPTNPDLLKHGLLINDEWWSSHLPEVVARYQEWTLG